GDLDVLDAQSVEPEDEVGEPVLLHGDLEKGAAKVGVDARLMTCGDLALDAVGHVRGAPAQLEEVDVGARCLDQRGELDDGEALVQDVREPRDPGLGSPLREGEEARAY